MKRILAFEGDEELAAQLKAGLFRYGVALDVVDDAEVGVDKAILERPDLILLSIELPKTNGFSVCNRLKKNKTLKAIPLIITSSECSEETFRDHRKMKTRAEDYLHKPFEFAELLDKVHKLIALDVDRPKSSSAHPPADSEGSESLEPARLTDIYNDLDGAFEEITEEDDEQGRTVIGMGLPPVPRSAPSLQVVPDESPPPLPFSCTEQCLLVLWTPDATLRGQTFCFRPDAECREEAGEERVLLKLGQSPDNDVVVVDPSMSTIHFQLERSQSGLFLRDLGSGNGTFVNDELVSYQELRGGEIIRAGDTTLLCLFSLDLDEQFERVIYELSVLDPLTRVFSARALRERLDEKTAAASQDATPLSLAAVSIDDLFQIVYRYGDLVAERVIEEIANMLRTNNPRAIVGRDFGEGFLVILPDTSQKMAVGIAEGWRFEATVSEIIMGDHSVSPTLSVGVIQWREGWSVTDLIRRAYRLLWEASNSGGNRVLYRSAADSRNTTP